MSIFFYNPCKNFGDCINDKFFNLLCNKKNKYIKICNHDHILATGSILTKVTEKSIIYGCGFISEDSDLGGDKWNNFKNKVYSIPKKIIMVRGKKTRDKLLKFNINCPESYGDPLMLFPLIYNKNKKESITVGIIPHYIDIDSNNYKKLFLNLKKHFTVKFINIQTDNYKEFINNILDCHYIISSSLHGIIMGLAYKKKTIFLQFGNKVTGGLFKFYDFFSSVDIFYQVKNIYTKEILENVIEIDYNKYKNICKNIINKGFFIEKNRQTALL